MRLNKAGQGILIMLMGGILPAVMPATARAAHPVAPAAINSVEDPGHTAFMLQEVRDRAVAIRNQADNLGSLMRMPFESDWQYEGRLLDRIRGNVNKMNQLVYELRQNTADDPSWERAAIQHTAPTAVNLADTTETAIKTLNADRDHIFASDFDGLVNDIYLQSKQIDQTVYNFEKYNSANQEARQLGQTLQLKSNS